MRNSLAAVWKLVRREDNLEQSNQLLRGVFGCKIGTRLIHCLFSHIWTNSLLHITKLAAVKPCAQTHLAKRNHCLRFNLIYSYPVGDQRIGGFVLFPFPRMRFYFRVRRGAGRGEKMQVQGPGQLTLRSGSLLKPADCG